MHVSKLLMVVFLRFVMAKVRLPKYKPQPGWPSPNPSAWRGKPEAG